MLVADSATLAAGAAEPADVVIPKAQEAELLHETLRKLLKAG